MQGKRKLETHGSHRKRLVEGRRAELNRLNASYKDRKRGHMAKHLMNDEKTADGGQWTYGLFAYCRDRFTDPERDEGEQQRWLDTITEWAEADPLQEKPHSQDTETFAAPADIKKTGTGPGGDQATVEMWHKPPCAAGADSVHPFRQVPGDAPACGPAGHLASSAHGGASKTDGGGRLERTQTGNTQDRRVPSRFHTIGDTQGWQTSAVTSTIREAAQFGDGEHGHSAVFRSHGYSPCDQGAAVTSSSKVAVRGLAGELGTHC